MQIPKELYVEILRLHQLGFSLIWLHPKSKRPIDKGWTSGPRKTLKELEDQYRKGCNIGVRTGETSKLDNGYLACIDVDVKDAQFTEEAVSVAEEILGFTVAPQVRSGSGNGSRHYYIATKKPFKMITVIKRPDEFEVCIYSTGRQMVLPPSIHPDTGKRYAWFDKVGSRIPLIDQFACPKDSEKAAKVVEPEFDESVLPLVEVEWLPIPDKIRKGILVGSDVADRSAFLLPATTALVSAGLEKNEILSVLTDPKSFLGACAYDHAKTQSRKVAARWIWKYTLQKVIAERESSEAFLGAADIKEVQLSDDDAAAQAEELENWKAMITRAKHGNPYTTIENVVLILKNAIRQDIVKFDKFSYREHFTLNTPWGAKAGENVLDPDIPAIRLWLGQQWRFEPAKETITDALTVIGRQNAYDPVIDSFEHLPEWDRKPRLNTWLIENFGATGDPEYLGQVFRKWLVAIVMRVYCPGAKFDWMPIFEGLQGIGKSSFGRLLVGDRYFLDYLPNLADKDAALGLQGIQAVEMGELASLRKNELEVVKGFLTRTIDKVRPPFGRKVIESYRRCVFYGTTNRDTYLRDDSGNRRFKPIKVGRLNFDALERDRNQLFAEAKYLFDTFQETEISLELGGQAKHFELQMHQEKMVKDESELMREILLDFIEKNEDFDTQKISVSGLFGLMGPFHRFQLSNANMQFAAKALKALEGEKRGIQGRNYWKLPKVDRFEGDF